MGQEQRRGIYPFILCMQFYNYKACSLYREPPPPGVPFLSARPSTTTGMQSRRNANKMMLEAVMHD